MSTDIHVVALVEGKPGSAEAIVNVVAPCITGHPARARLPELHLPSG